MMPWNDKHWTVDNKPPKELRTFDGLIQYYDKFRLRIRYHFISTKMFYKESFDLIEQPWAGYLSELVYCVFLCPS